MRYIRYWETLDRPAFDRLAQNLQRRTLLHSANNIPAYQSGKWAASFRKSDPASFTSWPVLEREDLHATPEAFFGKIPSHKGIVRKSSATSGPSLEIAWDVEASAWNWAHEYQALDWFGIPIGIPALILWRFRDLPADLVLKRKSFATIQMTEKELREAAAYLVCRRPPLLWGLPSALAQLASFIHAEFPDVSQPISRFAKVGGEPLFPFQRQAISRYLGARSIDHYGCSEAGAIAGECPNGNLHVFSTNVLLEVFQGNEPARPGEFGDLVVTTMHNRAMPLIRYRIGDQGQIRVDPCSCGLPYPVLAGLRARKEDLLITADGKQVHSSLLLQVLSGEEIDSFGDIRQFQFQQCDRNYWIVWIEGKCREIQVIQRHFEDAIWRLFGAGSRVELKFIDNIPREPSGKFRYNRIERPVRN
jgi:phenylacetate-CoA ligase